MSAGPDYPPVPTEPDVPHPSAQQGVCQLCRCKSTGSCEMCGGALGTASKPPCPRCPNGELPA